MYSFLKNKTILYIEDELDVLKNIAIVLNQFFKKVYLAADGETGQKIFLENNIDVLLIDIEIPKINGLEVIKKIRKNNKEIPVVIISAYTKKDYLLSAVELNLSKYIVKPLTSNKIHSLLKMLDKHFYDENKIQLTTKIVLDKIEHTATFENTELTLTSKELSFLITLAKKKIITYDEINLLWKNEPPTQNAIRTFIKQLRKKLPDGIIKTKNEIGYFIDRN